MLKNFKNGYQVSGSSEIASMEKNDCVVRAIANACDVNYSQAHKYVADTFDRKKGQGTQQFLKTLDKVKTMEFLSIPLLSPPLTGLINKGNDIGIEDALLCSPGEVIKKSAVLILAFRTSFFALFLSLSLSKAFLLDAI